MHEIEIADTSKIFDVELAAYLIYPEMAEYTCEKLFPQEFDGLQLPNNSPAAQVTAIEKLGKLYAEKLVELDMKKLYDEVELPLTKVLANMESYNAILIKQGCAQEERMKLLHDLAVQQMKTLSNLGVANLLQINS